MHYFSISYTFVQVEGKVWVGTIIVFCAHKNMFACLIVVRFLPVLKTCFYVFLCHCKVSAPAKTCYHVFVVDVGWLEGCFCAASPSGNNGVRP
jgi:hypothetical protein